MDFIIQVGLVVGIIILILFVSYIGAVRSKRNSNNK